jgi:parvulin-like peptidyl-prolyl isomerase
MIAWNRGRKLATCLVAAATIGALATQWASAQQRPGRASTTPPPAKNDQVGDGPRLQEVRVPVNTNDPIALVNGEIITRQQLADECVARKGAEILETLIARRLIEQAMRGSNLEITADEINAEIDSIAWTTAKADREKWLRILEKERGISPAMYVRDIVYPALALKKLAAKRVQVTEKDIKEAFEANFGERLRCRMIMVENVRTANEVWSELQKNPDGFERIAKVRSTDNGSKANGGLLPEPIARYANPREVSKAVFAQLVDGNAGDKDSKGNPIKPKDGAVTGPIQLHEAAWLIIKREELLPAKSGAKINDPNIQTILKEQMYEVKLNEAVASLFEDLMRVSKIDNKLTGQVKMANEEEDPEYKKGMTDSGVNRTASQGQPPLTMKPNGKVPVKIKTSPGSTPVTPPGVPSGAASATGQLQNAIRTAPPGTSTPPGN